MEDLSESSSRSSSASASQQEEDRRRGSLRWSLVKRLAIFVVCLSAAVLNQFKIMQRALLDQIPTAAYDSLEHILQGSGGVGQEATESNTTILSEPNPTSAAGDNRLGLHQRFPTRPLSKLAKTQVQRYRNGTGLVLLNHLTHHAGTTFCHTFQNVTVKSTGQFERAPSFHCMAVTQNEGIAPQDLRPFLRHGNAFLKEDDYGSPIVKHNWGLTVAKHPWTVDEMDANIRTTRKYFHMVAWEYAHWKEQKVPLAQSQWEHADLVSVVIMRDPMTRMFSSPAGLFFPRGLTNRRRVLGMTAPDWRKWEFVKDPFTNNFALRVLAGPDCCNGTHTERTYLDKAKALLQRMTFVLDIECLNEGMQALAEILDIDIQLIQGNVGTHQHKSKTPRERIANDEVYDALLARNRLDIELYEWSKQISLVNCSALPPTTQVHTQNHTLT